MMGSNRCRAGNRNTNSNFRFGAVRACRGTQKWSFEPVRSEPRNRAASPEGEVVVQDKQPSTAGVLHKHQTVNGLLS